MSWTPQLAALMARLPVFQPGHVWLTGAGPGDPGLLTLEALNALGQADLIVHDALVDVRVLDLARPEAVREFAGKRGGRPSHAQADISKRLITLAREGRRVLRLKGGDPCVFGRGGEEAVALAEAHVPFRIITGVTSGLAALSIASIPATMRGLNHALIFVTGHCDGADNGIDWAALARAGQPIVLYMGLRNLESIAHALMDGGLRPATPVAVIASATLPEQRILISRLDQVAEEAERAGFEPPAIIVIGEIVAARAELFAVAELVAEASL